MNPPFIYSNTFTLDKPYLAECYEESTKVKHSLIAYSRAMIFIAIAILLLEFSNVDNYIAAFILIIGIIDAAGVYFHKTWWLARQSLSGSYNSVVTLTINEESIITQSFQATNSILWTDITLLQQTALGWLIHHSGGRSYLSNGNLSSSAITYMRSRISQTK